MVRWREFERLSERILRDLSPSAIVTLDDHIVGTLSEISRQIDVSVRWSEAGQDYLLIVQAKDWSSPADVTAVDAFASVLEDVQADRGILVCRSGFTSSAHTYARNRGIALWNLHDAESTNWNLQLKVPLLWIDLLPTMRSQFTARLEGGDSLLRYGILPFVLTPDAGDTVLNPITTFEDAWNAHSIPHTCGVEHTIVPNHPRIELLVETAAGDRALREVDDLVISYTVERVGAWLGYFSPRVCRGFLDELNDQAFVVSHLPIGEIPSERDGQWYPLDDPDGVATRIRGTLVTTENYLYVVPGSGAISGVELRRIGD